MSGGTGLGGIRTNGGTPDPGSKRFLELCVNTGEFQKQLTEIDVSSVASDGQLFRLIRQRYDEVRRFRVNYFLLRPVDVHFVQFSVEDRHRVGICATPMAIPSEADMKTRGYVYNPYPLDPPIPIPTETFLHYLSKPDPHERLSWGKRMPQKLDSSILQMQSPPHNELVIGWGLHIIEALDKVTVLMCALAGLIVSGVVAMAWSIARDDVQGGFGMGAWVTSVLAIVLALVITKY